CVIGTKLQSCQVIRPELYCYLIGCKGNYKTVKISTENSRYNEHENRYPFEHFTDNTSNEPYQPPRCNLPYSPNSHSQSHVRQKWYYERKYNSSTKTDNHYRYNNNCSNRLYIWYI